MKPNLAEWAEAIIYGLANRHNTDIIWLESELKEIADKYYDLGFKDGYNHGWWIEQDKELVEGNKRIEDVELTDAGVKAIDNIIDTWKEHNE